MSNRDEHDHDDELIVEAELFNWEKEDFVVKIYDGKLQNDISSNYNAITITLTGTLDADLKWNEEIALASKFISQGYYILWDLDLGLFEQLKLPLSHTGQFLSLSIAIQQFREQIWEKFKEHTVGVCLYRGYLNFCDYFHWNEIKNNNLQEWLTKAYQNITLFQDETSLTVSEFNTVTSTLLQQTEKGRQLLRYYCLDAANQFLDLLIDYFPDRLPCYLFFDVITVPSYLELARSLINDRFERFTVAAKHSPVPLKHLVWSENTICTSPKNDSIVGICLPDIAKIRDEYYQGYEAAFFKLHEKNIPYKILSETYLTTDWEGLEYLLVSGNNISTQWKRKLQGFCAAGGTVVIVTDGSLGLPYEQSFNEWLANFTLMA